MLGNVVLIRVKCQAKQETNHLVMKVSMPIN